MRFLTSSFQRAGQLDDDEIKRMETIMLNPRQYKIPDWFLNRQKDWKDGTFAQCISNGLDTKLREDLERLKKVIDLYCLKNFSH